MTYCDGIPILQFARENKDNPEMLSTMCKIGINSICKMIFEDNFLHGTIYVRVRDFKFDAVPSRVYTYYRRFASW